MTCNKIIVTLFICLLVCSCGIKGNLYIPTDEQANSQKNK